MKNFNLLVIIAGFALMVIGPMLTAPQPIVNVADSTYPETNIAGNLPHYWAVFAGGVIMIVGAIFYFQAVSNAKNA